MRRQRVVFGILSFIYVIFLSACKKKPYVKVIPIFYATDRKQGRLQDLLHSYFWALLLLVLVVVVFFLARHFRKVVSRSSEKFLLISGSMLFSLFAIFFAFNFGYNAYIENEVVYRLIDNGSVIYGSKRNLRTENSNLEFGICTVTIPIDKHKHKPGAIERPSLYRMELSESEEKHVMIKRIKNLNLNLYLKSITKLNQARKSEHAFVFIHGYNTKFNDAMMSTAQLAYDLKFSGPILSYSWPSLGISKGYPTDKERSEWSSKNFEFFLKTITSKTNIRKLHIIAHSMGNRVLLSALLSLFKQNKGKLFGEVILAAPDVDVEIFRAQYAKAVKSLSQNVTLYASSKDKALITSKTYQTHRRVGSAGDDILILPGIDTVDASNVNTDFLSHSYFRKHKLLLADIKVLIEIGRKSRKGSITPRNWLIKKLKKPKSYYWSFNTSWKAD